MLSLRKVVDTFEFVLKRRRVREFVESRAFWPVAVKGGFECTLRDLVLHDLQLRLRQTVGRRKLRRRKGDGKPRRKVQRNKYVCTGERRWGRRKQRPDILILREKKLEEMGKIYRPLVEVELKTNFSHQVDKATGADYPTRSVAALRKIGAGRYKKPPVTFVGIQFIHELFGCNKADKRLAWRYSKYREDKGHDRTQKDFEELIKRKCGEIAKKGFHAKEIARYQLTGEDRGHGEMIALASWKKRPRRTGRRH